MRSLDILAAVAAFVSTIQCQTSNSTRYCDNLTGICYSSFTNPHGITYGIALPQVEEGPTDVILQIVAPIETGWVGMAWGGRMTYNPLTVAWRSGSTVMVSSRMAFGLNVPQPYSGAEYTYLRGTGTNSTHWSLTVRCRGCSAWEGIGGNAGSINPSSESTFAWAYATAPVSDPSSNTTLFQAHDAFGSWTQDLAPSRSSLFDSWVSSNILPPSNGGSPTSRSSTVTLVTSTALPSGGSSSTTVASASASAVPTSCPGVSAPRTPFQLASGWNAVKVAGNLSTPRGIIRDSQGRLLIVENGRGISQHTVSSDGCIQSSRLLISQNDLNHGIYLSPNGATLYASSMTTVWSWAYDSTSGNIQGAANVLVTDMVASGHVTRTLLVPPHLPDLLLVSHGSNGNLDYPTINPSTARAIVKGFNLTAIPNGGYNYIREGYIMGYGLRNEVGLALDGNNMLWGVENGGDSFARTVNGSSTDIHIDNPAEELNYLGDPAEPNNRWYGYPTCHTVWEPNVITDRRFSVGDQFVLAPNTTFDDSSCVQMSTPPRLSFQAHSAPLDAKFDANSSNLYVTFHGSWNRVPATGYKLVVVPFVRDGDGNYSPTASANSSTGYQDVFYHQDVTQCSAARCARPVGLVFDASERLYMTSDAAAEGEVFMLWKV